MDTQFNDVIRHIGGEFGDLVKIYNDCLQRTLNKYGLYPGQPPILFILSDLGKATQNEIAVKLGVSKASAGVSLRRMENAGFVKRVRDKHDSRCNQVMLTKKGMDYIRWCEIDFNMIFTTMLENFNSEQRAEILNSMKSMRTSLAKLQGRLKSKYEDPRYTQPSVNIK